MASGSASRRTERAAVLIVGNSVSLPPAASVPAYPERLAALLGDRWDIRVVIHSGATIEQMEAEVVEALARRPDALVLQVGINECAPRPLSVSERQRLGQLRPAALRQLIIRAIHHLRPHIIRTRRLHQFTPLPRFVASVRRIAAAAAAMRIPLLILPITPVTAAAERRTPYTNREVQRYNDGLAGLSGEAVHVAPVGAIFGAATADRLCHTPDTVHLGAEAHGQLARYVGEWVRRAAGEPAA